MKFITQLKRVFTIGIVVLIYSTSNAQVCSPDPSYTNGGVYPSTSTPLATGCAGSFYQQDFTVVVPPDTFGFPITYIIIDSIGGLPAGVVYSCNPLTCVFPGGTSQCFQIYGTPVSAGTYNFTIYVHGQAIVFGSPTALTFQYTGYQINIGSYPVLSIGNLPATCNSANGTGWVIASGSSGYTYSWTAAPVSNNDTIYNQNAGLYQVTVNSTYNCASVDTVIINDLGAPTVDTIIVNDVLCFGDTTGSALLVSIGGTLPYTYLWSTGNTNANLTNVGAGIYTVSVLDSNGCLLSSGATIAQPTLLQVFTSQNDVTCFGTNNGSGLATVVGGIGTYDYIWTSGSLAASAPSLSAGSYSVTVTDDNSCTASASLTILQPPVLNTNISGSNTSCSGGNNGSASVGISGGSPGYDILWSNGDTTLTANGFSAGSYYVSVMDTFGCVALDTIVIVEPSAIMISLSGTDETILGALDGAVDATVSGGTPGYTYLWSNSATSQDISGLAGGTYILEVTDFNGCTNSDTITIQTIPGFGVQGITDLFSLYPNPASEFIYINASTESNMYIYDLCGKQVLNKTINTGLQMVKVSDLTEGVYMVTLVTNEYRKTLRLIIR